MEIAYILTAASAIAITAIYFFCVRKPGTQGSQSQSFPDAQDVQH
jgi:hypothetical protein